MSVKGNSANLRIVKDCGRSEIELLLAGSSQPKRLTVEERDVRVPRVSVMLQGHFALELGLAGKGIFAHLPVVWHGTKKVVRGEIGTPFGPDIILPRGTLAKWEAQAA